MLIDSYGQTLLGLVLANYVFIKERFDFTGLGKGRPRGYRLSLLVVADDLVADVDTLIADIDRGPRNEFLHFILRLTTERTAQRVVGSSYHNVWGTPCETVAQSRCGGFAVLTSTSQSRYIGIALQNGYYS